MILAFGFEKLAGRLREGDDRRRILGGGSGNTCCQEAAGQDAGGYQA